MFSDEVYKSEEVVEDGLVPFESVGRTGSDHFTDRKVEVEAADGGSSRQERIGFVYYLFSWRSMMWRLRRSHPLWPRSFVRKACGWADGEGATEGVEKTDS